MDTHVHPHDAGLTSKQLDLVANIFFFFEACE